MWHFYGLQRILFDMGYSVVVFMNNLSIKSREMIGLNIRSAKATYEINTFCLLYVVDRASYS